MSAPLLVAERREARLLSARAVGLVFQERFGREVRQHLAALRLIALSLGRFLAVPREFAGLIVPDFDAFWWSDPAVRAAGRDVFGF